MSSSDEDSALASSEDETEYCLCRGKDDGRMMIQCDFCGMWYHTDCVGLTFKEARSIKEYKCVRCRNSGNPSVLGKRDRSSSPAGRRAGGTDTEEQSERPARERHRNPRYTEDYDAGTEVSRPRSKPHKPRKPRTPRTPSDTEKPPPKSRCIMCGRKAPPSEQYCSEKCAEAHAEQALLKYTGGADAGAGAADAGAAPASAPAPHLDEARLTARVRLTEALAPGASDAGEAERVAAAIEEAMFGRYGKTREYTNRLRSLLFNCKDEKNPALRQRLLSGEITPERVTTMDVWEMANDALASRRHELIQASDRNLIKEAEDTGPLIKKTHKGDMLVEQSVEVIPQLPSVAVPAAAAAAAAAPAPTPGGYGGGPTAQRSHSATPVPDAYEARSGTGRSDSDDSGSEADVPLAQRRSSLQMPLPAAAPAPPRLAHTGLSPAKPPTPSTPTLTKPPTPLTPTGATPKPPSPPAATTAAAAALSPVRPPVAPLVSLEYHGRVDPKAPGLAAFPVVGRAVHGPALHKLLPERLEVAGRTDLLKLLQFVMQLRQRVNSSSRSLTVLSMDAPSEADGPARAALKAFCDAYEASSRAATITASGGVTLHLVPTQATAFAGIVREVLGSHPPPMMGLLIFNAKP